MDVASLKIYLYYITYYKWTGWKSQTPQKDCYAVPTPSPPQEWTQLLVISLEYQKAIRSTTNKQSLGEVRILNQPF